MAPDDKKSALATTQPAGALATNTMFEAEKESGFEDMGMTDFTMPFLKLLQKLSPELDSSTDQYIEGAKVGQFMDSSTKELFDSLDIIPCLYQPKMVEWKPGRGGFVAQHEVGYEISIKAVKDPKTGKFVIPGSNNELIDTRYYFCLRFSKTGELVPVVIAMTSTQIKYARQWNSQMDSIRFQGKDGAYRPPMFSHIYTITAGDDKNEKGSWKTYQIAIKRPIGEKEAEMFLKAKDMRETFKETSKNIKPVEDAASTPSAPSGDSQKM